MENRLKLQSMLEEALGSPNVYFQPMENLKMEYPCIRYEHSGVDTKFADDCPYIRKNKYTVMLIAKDPEKVDEVLASLSFFNFSRHYTAGNLNHDVFDVYI